MSLTHVYPLTLDLFYHFILFEIVSFDFSLFTGTSYLFIVIVLRNKLMEQCLEIMKVHA